MLYDRIVDNKEIGRKTWKICRVFYNDLYKVERFVLNSMICTTLSNLYYVEWFAQRWIISRYSVEWFVLRWMGCITLNDLYYVELFVQRWMIFYFATKFVRRWKIRCAMDDLYNVESFTLRWIIEYRLFNECHMCLFEKIL